MQSLCSYDEKYLYLWKMDNFRNNLFDHLTDHSNSFRCIVNWKYWILNFKPLEVVYRYCDPELEAGIDNAKSMFIWRKKYLYWWKMDNSRNNLFDHLTDHSNRFRCIVNGKYWISVTNRQGLTSPWYCIAHYLAFNLFSVCFKNMLDE